MTANLTPAQADHVVELYRSGQSQNQIAAAIGIHQTTVSNLLKRRGERISRSEAETRKWATMTDAQRAAQVAPAHRAVVGMKRTDADLSARAVGKQRTQAHATDDERLMAAWMAERSIDTVLQCAIGKYNVDVAAEPVAVELFGGGWHAHGAHRAGLPKRVAHIADAGWNQMIVWTHRVHPLGPEVADELVAYVQRSRSDPTFRRQYRVIWGDGKFIAAGGVDDDEVTLVPTGIRGTYSSTR